MKSTDAFATEIVAIIRDLAEEGTFPAETSKIEISSQISLSEIGADSYAQLVLLTEVENRTGIVLEEADLRGAKTVEDLAGALSRKHNAHQSL